MLQTFWPTFFMYNPIFRLCIEHCTGGAELSADPPRPAGPGAGLHPAGQAAPQLPGNCQTLYCAVQWSGLQERWAAVLPGYLAALHSGDEGTVETALANLAEMAVLCQVSGEGAII